MQKLLHISDLHFGPPFVEAAGNAILAHLENEKFDAIVVTGDLTQRARVSQFVQAAAFLKKLENHAKIVVMPGNHDIPLYRAWERIFHPYRLFHDLVSKDRNSVLMRDGMIIVGLDSTHPFYRIKGGRLGKTATTFAQKALAEAKPGLRRVIALHHPLFLGSDAVANTALIDTFLSWDVDLVLCGHSHVRLARKVEDRKGRSFVLSQCGTSTSIRGRGDEAGRNSLNEIILDEKNTTVKMFELNPQSQAFEKVGEETFK